MIEVALLAASALSLGASDPQVGTPADAQNRTFAVRRETSRLEIPDEIAPAIVPYFQCLLASRGIPLTREGRVVTPTVAPGTDCSSQRLEAAQRAETMLRNRHDRNEGERAQFIEATLASLDRTAAQWIVPQHTSDSDASN